MTYRRNGQVDRVRSIQREDAGARKEFQKVMEDRDDAQTTPPTPPQVRVSRVDRFWVAISFIEAVIIILLLANVL